MATQAVASPGMPAVVGLPSHDDDDHERQALLGEGRRHAATAPPCSTESDNGQPLAGDVTIESAPGLPEVVEQRPLEGNVEAEPCLPKVIDQGALEEPGCNQTATVLPPLIQFFDLTMSDEVEPIGAAALEVLSRQRQRLTPGPSPTMSPRLDAGSSASSSMEAAAPASGNEWRLLEEELSRAQERARELLQGRTSGVPQALKERRVPAEAKGPSSGKVGNDSRAAATIVETSKERGVESAEDTEKNDKEIRKELRKDWRCVAGSRRCFDALWSELEAGLAGRPANVHPLPQDSPLWLRSSDQSLTLMVRTLASNPKARVVFFGYVIIMHVWAIFFVYRAMWSP